jgi:hypothetical protein
MHSMNPDGSRLLRHLSVAVVLKLAVLAALWWVFIRGQSVDAGSEQTASHFALPASPASPAAPAVPAGSTATPPQEASR